MDKQKYFNQLHQDLAKKHHIEPRNVYFIRNAMLGRGYSKVDLQILIESIVKRKIAALEVIDKQKVATNPQLKQDYEATLRHIKSMRRMLKFLQNASPEEINDINRKTQFDREKKLSY